MKKRTFVNGYDIAEMAGCGEMYYQSAINKILKETAYLDKQVLSEYGKEWKKVFGLQSDEQAALVLKIQSGDEAARRELVLGSVPLVIMVVQQYRNYSVSISNLIREGLKGVKKAAGRFDVQRGFKFSSFAVWWIRKYLLDEINKSKGKDTEKDEVKIYNSYQFCELVSDLYDFLLWEEPNDVFLWVERLEKEHKQTLASHLKKLGLNPQERTIFYLICHDFQSKDTRRMTLSNRLEKVYCNEKERLAVVESFLFGEHPLITQGLVEVFENQGDIIAVLTEKSQKLFLDEDNDEYNHS